ncbi:MAG: S8/S53 family peptidase [Propionibacteriaceae bacterium]|nr:S8/S53 family peptidase [Propionibacteriaceae bacterium]
MSTPRSLAALTLAAALLILPAPQAVAEEVITDQHYTTWANLAEHRSMGLTGKGVTIAYIEGAPDLSVPELQGADIEVNNPCNDPGTPRSRAHSTAVVSMIANRDWGWAPEAHIINYTIPTADLETSTAPCPEGMVIESAIHRALDDGVDIISISLRISTPKEFRFSLMRAARMGVPVVVSAGNTGADAHPSSPDDGYSIAALNTVVGVGALTPELQRAEFSSVGDFVTVMAPGQDIKVRLPDANGDLTVITPRYGTSYATPMVAGLLALGKQKWPQATGNQLIRSLIATATPTGEQPNPEYGYGIINSTTFLNTDPTTFEDSNPLFHRTDDTVTLEAMQDYQDGLLLREQVAEDPLYIYRGLDAEAVYRSPEKSHFGTSPRYHR